MEELNGLTAVLAVIVRKEGGEYTITQHDVESLISWVYEERKTLQVSLVADDVYKVEFVDSEGDEYV